jgi:Dynamin family
VTSSGGRGDPLEALHEPTARIVAELKHARSRLEAALSPQSSLSAAIRAFGRTVRRLDRPLRLAITGEFNSGKSSLANLLARIESLPTAVISNTRIPTLLYHAREPEIWAVHNGGKREWLRADRERLPQSIFRLEVGLPSPRLRAMQVLDLPGLADPRFHAPVDIAFHNVDAVVWCTMSTQAWKESERTAWSQLPTRLRTRGLLVSTHADLLHGDRDAEKLMGRLRAEAGSEFRDIILISTVDALALVQEGRTEPDWKATGAGTLETALHKLLVNVREQRAEAALKMTSRIADHALSHLEEEPA